MALWLLDRNLKTPNHAMVVRAPTMRSARLVAATYAEKSDEGAGPWLNFAMSTCVQLEDSGKAEVILVYFNAG